MNLHRTWLVLGYDFWLDFFSAPLRARRELRRELRANLADAEAAQGWPAARRGIGSVRELAREHAAAVRVPGRPAWGAGVLAAVTAFLLLLLAGLFAASVFFDGAEAAGLAPGQSVSRSLTLLPGATATASRSQNGLSLGMDYHPAVSLGLPALAFVLGAQPWRVLRRKR